MSSEIELGNRPNICVLSSGGGGNFRYLIEQQIKQQYDISSLVVDKICPAVKVANHFNIQTLIMNRRNGMLDFDQLASSKEIMSSDIIILAGFMPIVPASFINKYGKLILNTHPSLLPRHGGKGMYGVKVQESVIDSGDVLAGCTCHIVDDGIDTGSIICQKKIAIDPRLSPWELGGEVFLLEGPNLVDAINLLKTYRWSKDET